MSNTNENPYEAGHAPHEPSRNRSVWMFGGFFLAFLCAGLLMFAYVSARSAERAAMEEARKAMEELRQASELADQIRSQSQVVAKSS